MLNGVLIVDKPAGWTSFDVVAKMRGVLGTKKIGHSGTLDPMATGVLPLFVGPAARAVDMQQDHTKAYEAKAFFGLRTDTGDITGRVLEEKKVLIEEAAVKAALPFFVGKQMQTPPMYSAVKVNGQPLYKLARKGQEAVRAPRPIEIFSFDYLRREEENEFWVRVSCSKGTYVRVLIEELGQRLDAPAVLSGLRRIRSGAYTLEKAHTVDEICRAKEEGRLKDLLYPVDSVFPQYPAVTVGAACAAALKNGAKSALALEDGVYRAYFEEGFLGLFEVQCGEAKVKRLFIEREG